MDTVLVTSSLGLWIVVTFNLLLTIALIRERNARKPQSLKAGQRAPHFTAESLDGDRFTLSSYTGRAVAFLFVGAHCSACREALPRYNKLYPNALKAGVQLVLVSVDDIDETRAFVEESIVDVPVLIAPHGHNPFMKDYKIAGTPSYCLISAEGVVQSSGFAIANSSEWKALTDSWEQVTEIEPAGLKISKPVSFI